MKNPLERTLIIIIIRLKTSYLTALTPIRFPPLIPKKQFNLNTLLTILPYLL